MIEPAPSESVDEIPPGSRRVLAVEPIDGETGTIALMAVYRHFRPHHEQFDFHTFRFRYTVTDDGEYLLGLDEWVPPERTVSAWQVGMLRYGTAYCSHHGVTASMSVPVHEHGDYLEGLPADSFEHDADLGVTEGE